jgi:hypothetical protein
LPQQEPSFGIGSIHPRTPGGVPEADSFAAMPTGLKVIVDPTVGGEKALRVAG